VSDGNLTRLAGRDYSIADTLAGLAVPPSILTTCPIAGPGIEPGVSWL